MENIDIASQLDSFDLSSVDTSMPFLKAGLYLCTVAEVLIIDQKAPKTGKNLKIKLTLVNPGESVEGKPVSAGFPIFDQISLTKTFNEDGSVRYDPLPALARFREAVVGSKEGSFAPVEQYLGRQVGVQLTYSDQNIDKKTGQDYGPQNRVKNYVKAQ